MVRIPSEYQEVEYIESTGTQWIDTMYIPTLSPVLKMKIRVTNRDDKDIAGFVSNVYPSFIIDAAPAQSRWYNRYGNTAAYGVNPGPVVGQIQEWEWGKEVKINGNLVHTNTECDWSSNTQKMNIFSGRNKAFVAIYSCSLYDGDLVRNFIPCYRKSDNEIGMYDTVSKTFFTNQGTRTFRKGNNVNYDTVNLMESRRRILLNTPHIESLSGSTLSFKTDMASKLKECKIHFTPVQEGTGDPSPDNVRPIHGWDGVSLNENGTSITIPFPQTIYGGYVDLVNGEVVETCSLFSYIWGDGTNQSSISDKYRRRFRVTNTTTPLRATENICNVAPWLRKYSSGALHFYNENGYAYAFLPQDTSDGTNIEMALELATPNTYSLIDPVTLRALRGQNNIWSDANGNIELKFWTH